MIKSKNINLLNLPEHKKKLGTYRSRSTINNLSNPFAEYVITKLLHSPAHASGFTLSSSDLVDKKGNKVPIKNGIPNFTKFSSDSLDEKKRQAAFHDDEELNETFDEIVFRPYNHDKFHAEIWLKHLFELSEKFEEISNQSIEGLNILNCGCGGGFEAQFLAEQGANVVGFDISQLRAEAAATRFSLHNLDGFFYRGDAAILPFKDNTFDIVLYHDSLHHVPIEEIPKAIKEARRVTKKYIILSEAHDSPVRMILESFGLSTSIEASGNYTFRFKKSLIEFWAYRFGMDLKLYKTSFHKREHRPNIYKKTFIGALLYHAISLLGYLLNKVGNEALIILEKSENNEYLKPLRDRSYNSLGPRE
jgi:ubiquinone/menaquinone biosynthesis C-methylase UbiE